jgi:transposase
LTNKKSIVDLVDQTLKFFQQESPTMLGQQSTQILSFQEVKILGQRFQKKSIVLSAIKISEMEVCPKCATQSRSIYDHRNIKIRDEPLGNRGVILELSKRRFWCGRCEKPLTEPVVGIKKGHRTSERFKRAVLWGCESFTRLKKVQTVYKISPGYVFTVFYQQLELQRRMNNQYPWPATIGLDEHSFRRTKGYVDFASVFIDYKKKRIFEAVDGKSEAILTEKTQSIPGKENVKNVVIDMCEAFRNFTKNNFPDAKITIDKFHVLKLISRPLSRCRREKVGHLTSHPSARLLFKREDKLEFEQKVQIAGMINLKGNETLKEYYNFHQRLHQLYNTRGHVRAERKMDKLIELASKSNLKPIKTLSETLTKWKVEILNYFTTKLTNARTEGFNNLAKLVQRRAFGYKNFENYRLRLLYACH